MLKYFILCASILFAKNTLIIDSKIIAEELERPLLVRFEPEQILCISYNKLEKYLLKMDRIPYYF